MIVIEVFHRGEGFIEKDFIELQSGDVFKHEGKLFIAETDAYKNELRNWVADIKELEEGRMIQ